MLRWLVVLLLLLPFCADAQSVPNGGAITAGQVWTPSQWTNAWQSKLDASGGVSTNGTFNNPTINGATISGITTGDVSSATAEATGSSTARALANRFAEVINVKDFGAKGDAVSFGAPSGSSPGTVGRNGTITGGTKTFVATTSTTFTSSDVGKSITIDGAGTAAGPLATTIAAFVGPQTVTLTDTASTTTPAFQIASCPVTTDQSGAGSYAPGDTITLNGGTGTAAVCGVQATMVHSASINSGGSGGTNGACVLTGTTGAAESGGGLFQINATISGGAVTSLGSFVNQSAYTTNPTSLSAEPVTGCNLSGATLTLTMGVKYAFVTSKGLYSVLPAEPISQATTSGVGTGATFSPATNATGSFVYGTDDSAAFSSAIGAVNAKQAQHIPTVLYIPAGIYLIRSTALPMFSGTAGIIGAGPTKSIIRVDTPYFGDLFSWSDSWDSDYPYNGTTPGLSKQKSGSIIEGIGIIGDLSAPSVQNAFMFYDRTDFLIMRDVSVTYLNGRGISFGQVKNFTNGWLRESALDTIRMFNVGTASVPVLDLYAQGSSVIGGDDISIRNIQIYAPASTGVWIHTDSQSNWTHIWADILRVEGLEHASNNNAGDLVRIGDSSGNGAIKDVQINSGALIDPYPGGAALHIMSPSGLSGSMFGIIYKGNIGGGDSRGKGLWLGGGRQGSYFFDDIASNDYNIQVDSSSFVGAGNIIGSPGANQVFTWKVDPTSANSVLYPVTTVRAGNIIAQDPDGSVVAGNTRGTQATDLQTLRSSATQVASGSQSVIAGGASNTANGQYSTVAGGNLNTATTTGSTIGGGQANIVSGQFSVVPGGLRATDRGAFGAECMASGFFAIQGDSQRCSYTLRGSTSSTTAVTLTSDSNAPSSANCVDVPTTTGYLLNIDVMAMDHTNPSNNEAWAGWSGKIHRPDAVSSTAVVMGTKPTPITSGTVTGSDISATADTTNGCLALSFTPPTGNTDTWRAVATVRTVQVQ